MKHLLIFVQARDAWRFQSDSMILPPAPVPGRLIRSIADGQWYWQVGEFVRGFHSQEEGMGFLSKLHDMLVEGVEPEEIEDDRRER